MKIKLHTHFKHWIFIVLSMFLCNLSALAVQLQIGQTTYFSVTAPEGYITSASWSSSAPELQTEPQMEVCTVYFWHYCQGNVTVTCNFTYTYQSYYNGRYHNKIGNGSRSFIVTCVKPSFSFDKTKVTLHPGEKMILSTSTSPTSSPKYPKVYWQNSNSSVAEIKYDEVYDNSNTQKCTILAKNPGTSTITASIGGGISATCEITVANIEPETVSLPSTASTKVGESLKLTPTLYPSDAETTYSWSSDNTGVATVSQNGLVSGKKTGMANITVRTANGKSATCRVTVEKGDLTLSCNTESGLIVKGTKVTLTANRSDAEIYYTLDGSTPTANSNRYIGSIIINESLALKAIAIGSEYNPTIVLTRDFQVTTLFVVNQNPIGDIFSPNAIPTISFNETILVGSNYSDISLKDITGQKVEGELVLSDNTLYYVPSAKLKVSSYTLVIPEKSVINMAGEPNANITIQFRTLIPETSIVKEVFARFNQSFALTKDGTLWAWGDNEYGQLGDGTKKNSNKPLKVFSDVTKVAVGSKHTLIIRGDTSLWSLGDNNSGQLGNNSKNRSLTPIKIMDNIVNVSADYNTSMCIDKNGNLYGWGADNKGQLMNKGNQLTPIKLMDNVSKVICASNPFALKKDASLWHWGYYLSSISGNSSFYSTSYSPTKIYDNIKNLSVSQGGSHYFVVKKDDTLWSWGVNVCGTLGNDSFDSSMTPSKIMDSVSDITSGQAHALALKKDKTVWGWGLNLNGQVGDGANENRNKPSKIIESVKSIAVGEYHSLALKEDGTLWSWGKNDKGQLGTGNNVDSNVPVQIPLEFFYANPVSAVDFGQENYSIKVNEKTVLIPKLTPSDADYEAIAFSSSNTDVASVTDRGVLYAKQLGSTVVTVTVNGQFTSTCKVTVEESTGINEVESKRTADGHIYSLSGQRLAAPKKGINIINGRKVIVK